MGLGPYLYIRSNFEPVQSRSNRVSHCIVVSLYICFPKEVRNSFIVCIYVFIVILNWYNKGVTGFFIVPLQRSICFPKRKTFLLPVGVDYTGQTVLLILHYR
jgi:hypothetical protein